MRAPIPPGPFDVVVIGGGIVGMAIARAAARAGKSTLLLEQHDFASGATCRSPRTVGDVFADIERGDFGVARETLRERDRLLMQRPHLVRPVTGVIALGPQHRRSNLEVRFGLWLRRRLGNGARWSPTESDITAAKDSLSRDQAISLFPFDDAICEFPERLVAEWLREAVAAGAVARNYCRALEIVVRDSTARGVKVRDICSDIEQFIDAEWVVNATGSFSEQLCSDSGIETARMIAQARAVHLVLQRFAGAPEVVMHCEGVDGKEVVLTPWNGQLLLGAIRPGNTGLPFAGPSEAEVEYLQRSLHAIFPAIGIQVNAAFASPIATYGESAFDPPAERNRNLVSKPSAVQRLLTATTGSLSALTSAIAECARHIGFERQVGAKRDVLPGRANGIDNTLRQWAHAVSNSAHIPERVAESIAAWHGRGALCIARAAARAPELKDPICDHTDHIVAEAIDAVRYEGALTLSDILLRRVPVALSSCWSDECTRVAAERIGKKLNWNDAQIALQVENLETERASFLARPRPLRDQSDRLAA